MSSSWYSNRFQSRVHLSHHAVLRMQQRSISEEVVRDLIETGAVKHKDERHLWIFKAYTGRRDNLLCAAAVSGASLVVKTLMSHWQEDDQ